MKLGAQLYSVRNGLQTPEKARETFRKIRDIGYENVQFSGAPTNNAELLKTLSEEFDLPIVCTHVALNRIIEETESLIREHQTFGCPVIGLGFIPKEYRDSLASLRAFLKMMKKPVAKLREAGLKFAYHNHAFEFEKVAPNTCLFDVMLEECPDWQFIADTYWIEYAGYSAASYFEKIGSGRLTNVHFKDMAKDDKRSICSCGAGTLDFKKLAEVSRKLGVENVLVEQDNAADLPDPFAAMKSSFVYLRPLI